MPTLSFLEQFFSEHYRQEVHYLTDSHKEPETWQEDQQERRS